MGKKITAEDLLIAYESARQEVKRLESVRLNEISKCPSIQENADDWDGKNCLAAAWDEMSYINKHDIDFYDYDEVLFNNEEYCEHCKEAYRIKHVELAQAKQEFGKSKRAISAAGKRLIKAANHG